MNSTTLDTVKRVGWTAIQAFIGAVTVLAPGIWTSPNLKDAKAVAVSAVIAGIAAAASAVKNALAKPGTAVR